MHRSRFASRHSASLTVKLRKKAISVSRLGEIESMASVAASSLIRRRKGGTDPDCDSFSPHGHMHGCLHFIFMVVMTDRILRATNQIQLLVEFDI
jgi:hypothetical protein